MNETRKWQAVLDRDATMDGQFVYGVRTTGVYCRPSCPARRPRRDNVRFYDSPADAGEAGLRPCRRCRPLERWRQMLSEAEVTIASALTWRTARKLGYDIAPASRFAALGALLRLDGWRSRLVSAAKYAFLESRELITRPIRQR